MALFALGLTVLAPCRAGAQEATSAPPTFDLLQSAHSADSLRRVVSRQQAALVKASQAGAAKNDTIARQRRELAALAAMVRHDSLLASSRAVDTTAAVHAPTVVAPAPVVAPTPVASTPVASSPVAAPSASAPAAKPPARPAPPTISGLLQLWLTAGDAGYRNSYRVRRAEVRASGLASTIVSWSVMLDLAKALSVSTSTAPSGAAQTSVSQASRALQDAVIMLQLDPRARVDVGQQKIPFGIEGFQSSSSLLMVERALFASDRARGGSFGDTRDVGISVRGRLIGALDYNLGLFNGSGESQNDVDANIAKAIAAHLAFHPASALLIGASAVRAGDGTGDAPKRDRIGAELRLQPGKWLVQSEVVAGHDGPTARRGGYAHAGYHLRSSLDVHARVDVWDPNTAREDDAASATERDFLAGLSWSMAGAPLRAQLNAARRTYSASLIPARSQLSLNLQTTW